MLLKQTDKGFTLVETMIAAAVIGGLALVAMNLTKITTKSSVKYQFDSETNLITNEIVGILSSPSKCLATFSGKNALNTSSGISSINGNQYYISANLSAPSNGYGNAGVKISSYSLNATAADITANTSYLSIVYLNKQILNGTNTITKKIKLYVEVNGSNLITACHSIASHSTDIWSRGSGTDIFYSGNVGIGTTTPRGALDINGAVRLKSGAPTNVDLSTNGLAFEDNGDTGLFMTNYSGPATGDLNLYVNNQPQMTILGSNASGGSVGNVGIGTTVPVDKLHVSGGYIRGQLNCRKVTGPTANVSIAQCAGDEYVTSGGGSCQLPNNHFLHYSAPSDDLSSWSVDCFGNDGTDASSIAFAICCKK